jgi:hypothetical protein
MSAYLQLGHDSISLVAAGELADFSGVVLSPVNSSPADLRRDVTRARDIDDMDVVLDPQLYFPAQERGHLAQYKYYPSDFETADRNSDAFWSALIEDVSLLAEQLGVNAVCSPVFVPKKYDNRYFERCMRNYELLRERLSGIRPIMTVCVSFNEFGDANDAYNLSSRLTQVEPDEAYIILTADVKPRRELSDRESIVGMLAFLRSLEEAHCETLVSHCSSELILLKAAGVSNVASGKYFNLRRFTAGRFKEDEESGGKNMPYWFEEGLLAFLRQEDIIRIRRARLRGILRQGESDNPYGRKIMDQVETSPASAWIGLGWRQYLTWFSRTEARLSGDDASKEVSKILVKAEQNWKALRSANVVMQESTNDGSWIEPWQRAFAEFRELEF